MSGKLNTLANYLWSLAPGAASAPSLSGVHLVAHRGAHDHAEGRVENTLAAFDACLTSGVWGVEMDIRLTRDLEPVIHHDADCGRLFRRPDLKIADTDFSTLRSALPDIPHLDEIVSRYGGRMHLMLEIKESWRERSGLVQSITERLSGLVPENDYHLLALEPDFLEGFEAIPPSAYIDVAQTNTRAILKQTLALGHGALAGSFALIGDGTLTQLRAAGCRVGTGMVDCRGVLNREVTRDIDWIFTDAISRLQPLLPR